MQKDMPWVEFIICTAPLVEELVKNSLVMELNQIEDKLGND